MNTFRRIIFIVVAGLLAQVFKPILKNGTESPSVIGKRSWLEGYDWTFPNWALILPTHAEFLHRLITLSLFLILSG